MKIYAVIDTNVIISALLSNYDDSATVQIVRRVISGEIVPIYNDEILTEYISVMRRPLFGFPDSLIEYAIGNIVDFGVSTDRLASSVELLDPKDVVFYEVALTREDAFLVTGNLKHFPKEPFIVTPAEMLHIMDSMDNLDSKVLSEPIARYGRKSRGL